MPVLIHVRWRTIQVQPYITVHTFSTGDHSGHLLLFALTDPRKDMYDAIHPPLLLQPPVLGITHAM